MARIIEFAGLPGSGKSTVRSGLLAAEPTFLIPADIGRQKITIVGQHAPAAVSQIVSLARSAGSERRAMAFALPRLARSRRSVGDRASAARFVLVTADVLRRSAQESPGATVVIDEGRLQRAFMVLVDRPEVAEESVFVDFAERWSRDTTIIWVDTPPEVALERLGGRGRGLPQRLAGLADSDALDVLRDASNGMAAALAALEASGTTVIRIDGTKPVEQNVAAVRAALAAGVGGAGRRVGHRTPPGRLRPMTEMLGVIRAFLDGVDGRGVSYCHWKSNLALDRSLAGKADLDLLVDEADREEFEKVLADIGAVEVVNIGPKWLPGLEDWLALDRSTGRIVHLHVHYRLVLGEQRVKNHRLPIEEFVLQRTRVLDDVRVPTAEVETLLLFIRSLLKSTNRMCLRTIAGRRSTPFPDTISSELDWLLESCDDPSVIEAATASGLPIDVDQLADYLIRARAGRLGPWYVLRARRKLLHDLRPLLRGPRSWGAMRKIWLRLRFTRIARKLRPIPAKRVVGRAPYVAFVGADGSGKSTLTADIARWPGAKLSTVAIFNGQPKRDVVVRSLRRLSQRVPTDSTSGLNGPKVLLNLRFAATRLRLHRQARQLNGQGITVVSDRYPMPEFWDMDLPMDGPRLLDHESDGGYVGVLAQEERRRYTRIGRPDLVVVLDAPFEVLSERKPDTPPDQHREKVAAVNALAGSGRYRSISVTRPYDEVLLEAKGAVWDALIDAQSEAT